MPKISVNAVDRSTSYRPDQIAAIEIRQIAFDGEIGQGSIPIPDPAGTYEVYAGQALLIEDGVQTIINGFVGGTDRDKGESAGPPRRDVVHSLVDENALLYGFRADGWPRPSETTRTRFLAFLAAFVPGLDTTWVLNTNVATMPAKVYRTETLFTELLEEIRDLTGNTAFIEGRRAHLHLPTEGQFATISVSDTTFDFATAFPPRDPRRTKDGYELDNDVRVRTPQGETTVTDATSIARHDVAGIKHQRLVELDSGDAATRTTKATAILAESKNERITYECEIGPLTAAQVNAIPPGSLVNVTSQVMGLSSSTQRVATRSLRYHHPGKWYARLELGYPVRIRLRPPRTVNPVEAANAVIRPADLENCGGAIVLGALSRKRITEGTDFGWGSYTAANATAGSFHITNLSHPNTPCGIGLGAWIDRTDVIARFDFTVGADSGECVHAVLGYTMTALNHAHDGVYIGALQAEQGPYIWYGAGGAAGAASHRSAMALGAVEVGSSDILIPLTVITFGGTTTFMLAPGFHVQPAFVCHDELVTTVGTDGACSVTIGSLQFKKLPAGAYGWFWGGLVGTQDGANRTFTLRGGYTRVRSVTRNGIYVPDGSWVATDGSTITFAFAPLATDLIAVERYVPK